MGGAQARGADQLNERFVSPDRHPDAGDGLATLTPMTQPMTQVTVVGIGADGWVGVPQRLRDVVERADVLLGGSRHLVLDDQDVHHGSIMSVSRRPW